MQECAGRTAPASQPETESAMFSNSSALRLSAAALCALTALAAHALPADPRAPAARPGQPPTLAGSWSWTDPQQCSETYEYAADGSGRVSSGQERAEMAYIFDPVPLKDGFYRLEATITRDNGGTDCAGSASDDTNERYTVYLKFHPDGDQHIVCMEADLKHCFGPLKRGRGSSL